jgi:hypothetical protein
MHIALLSKILPISPMYMHVIEVDPSCEPALNMNFNLRFSILKTIQVKSFNKSFFAQIN